MSCRRTLRMAEHRRSNETFGKDDDASGDGATAKLGPANLERHKDGSITIDGEKVENPDDYKGEPIAGGLPTDD